MEEKETAYMYLKVSMSGAWLTMASPSGKQNVFCNLQHMQDLIAGNSDVVKFTVMGRTASTQGTFDHYSDEGEKELGGE